MARPNDFRAHLLHREFQRKSVSLNDQNSKELAVDAHGFPLSLGAQRNQFRWSGADNSVSMMTSCVAFIDVANKPYRY